MGNPYDEPTHIVCDFCEKIIKNDVMYFMQCKDCGAVACNCCADSFIGGYCESCYVPEEEADE